MAKNPYKNNDLSNLALFGKNKIISYDGYLGLVYARVSSKRQAEEGTGLQSQETRCKMFLESKGIAYVKTFPDSFTGGGDFMDRPQMRELINYIDTHPHQKFVVVFDDLSRFARDVQFHIKLKALFHSKGVLLECLNFKFEDTPESELSENIFATFAQYHRTNNRRQVIQKQQARLFAGYRPFPAPLGYTKVKSSIHGRIDTPNDKAPFIKEALEGFATKRFMHKIDVAKFLQKHNVIKKVQTPDKAIKTVAKLLREVFYAGCVEYQLWEVTRRKGHHEAIISMKTYNINQRRLDAKTTTYSRVDLREDFELRGLVNCAGCGHKFTGAPSTSKTGKKHNYYKCNTRGCKVYGKSILVAQVHDKFGELLKGVKANQNTIDLTLRILKDVWQTEMHGKNQSRAEMTAKKQELENTISQFALEAIKTTNLVVKSQYEKQIETLTAELEPLETLLSEKLDYQIPCRTSQEQVVQALKNPYSVWKNYKVGQKQRFYNFVFEGNLAYDKKDGYRTPNFTLPVKLFGVLANDGAKKVEMAGITSLTNTQLRWYL